MKFTKKYFYILTGFAVFIIYLFTLAPSVVQIDSGELATVQATLGIAHPTGYPLFTMIGYLFSLIPLPTTKIFQLNLLSAIYCSTGISVFVYTAKLVLDNINSFSTLKPKTKKGSTGKKKNKKEEKKGITTTINIPKNIKYIVSLAGGIILALSETYWMQSTSVEVYSLHLLLINIIILLLVNAYLADIGSETNYKVKAWLIFAIALALGFTNHMTTLLVIPGVSYLFFASNKFFKESAKKILLMLAVFFPVLIIIYLYLPLRASQQPLLNWGNSIDFERIIRHISGKQYQVWLFGSTDAAKRQLVHFFETLPGEFSFGLILSLIGMFISYKYARRIFIFLVVTFLFTVLYSINYDIHDIDSYFLLAYISLGFFSVFGLIKLAELVKNNLKAVIGISLILITVQFVINFNKVNQSGNFTYEDYTRAILTSVPKDAIIFSYQWDYFVSESYYFRYVEDFRKDVVIVDKELLRRSWYYDQLRNDYPDLLIDLKADVNSFKKALVPFERGETYNATLLESLYRKIMQRLITTNADKRDYYIAPEIYENEMQRREFSLPNGYHLVPDLLLFKVVKGNNYVPAPNPDFTIRFNDRRDYYIDTIEKFIGSMLARRAMYELQFGKLDRAKVYIQKIKKDLPGHDLPIALKNILPNN